METTLVALDRCIYSISLVIYQAISSVGIISNLASCVLLTTFFKILLLFSRHISLLLSAAGLANLFSYFLYI